MTEPPDTTAERVTVAVTGAELEIFRAPAGTGSLVVAAAHPASAFGSGTASLIADIARTTAVCVNARGLGGSSPAVAVSLEQTVDDVESARLALGLPPWVFWGMSGGGWLAQLYARRHPGALLGIVVESACASFRARLADPACVLSPHFPGWRDALVARGLLLEGSRDGGERDSERELDSEWLELEGLGHVFRRRGGPALLVAPMAVDPDMMRAMPQLLKFDSREWLPSLRLPTLVIAGSLDPVVPVRHVRAVHEAVPGSTFVLIDGAGHVPSSERRDDAVDQVRRFLARFGERGSASSLLRSR